MDLKTQMQGQGQNSELVDMLVAPSLDRKRGKVIVIVLYYSIVILEGPLYVQGNDKYCFFIKVKLDCHDFAERTTSSNVEIATKVVYHMRRLIENVICSNATSIICINFKFC